MGRSAADIVREYGPFPGVDRVNGVTFDGERVWFASGGTLQAFDPASGKTVRSLEVAAHAGTAFDGRHLFQLAEDRIDKIDPQTGRVLASIPAPGGGGDWGWRGPKARCGWGSIASARSIRSIRRQARFRHDESNRFVTGVTWVEGELWHATWEGDASDVRHIFLEPARSSKASTCHRGSSVSGLESDGGDRFFCGGGKSGKVRAVRRPKR